MLGAGVRYRVALNLNNVFNKKYYTSQFRGTEREVMLDMKLSCFF